MSTQKANSGMSRAGENADVSDVGLDGLLEAVGHDAPPRPRWWRALLRFTVWAPLLAVVVACLAVPAVLPPSYLVREAAYAWEDLPTDLPLDAGLPQRNVLTDRNGKVFAVVQGQDRTPVPLAQVAPVVVDALLATEDDRFYDKGPLDLAAFARAALRSGAGDVQGGSGLTQQYVKNLLLTEARTPEEEQAATEQTLARKLRELKYAVALEQQLTKDQILERYLNTVNFGDGAYGIAAAARHYFSVSVDEVTLTQAALLVGILKSPTNYNPVDNLDRSTTRRNAVLARMRETGRITAAESEQAQASPVTLDLTDAPQGCGASRYPFFCQWVVQALGDDKAFGATAQARQERLFRGGLTVRTSLDPAAMAAAQKAANAALTPKNRVATGVAVVEPGTGQVSALVTSKSWGRDASRGQTQLILPALAAYQPGSTFKAVTLATGLERGIPLTTRFNTPDGYVPVGLNHPRGGFHNDDDRGHGVIDAYAATAGSVNTWFIQLEERTGVLPVADMAARLGITSLPRSGARAITRLDASLTLGSYEVSPLELATAYATIAAGGVACRPIVVLGITDSAGTTTRGQDARCRQAVSPYVAAGVTSALQRVMAPGGTGSGVGLAGRPSAGKTGTTNDSAATWFAGFTPQYAMAVWVGDPRGGQKYPLRNVTAYGQRFAKVYGRSIAGPIWKQTMTELHASLPVQQFDVPAAAALLGSRAVVPDLRGLGRDAALSALVGAGFRAKVANTPALPDPAYVAGQVVAQKPLAGSLVDFGSTVVITLADGSEVDVVVPSASPR